MKVLWIVVILCMTPDGTLVTFHDPEPFRNKSQCIEFVDKAVSKLREDIIAMGGCYDVITGENI